MWIRNGRIQIQQENITNIFKGLAHGCRQSDAMREEDHPSQVD